MAVVAVVHHKIFLVSKVEHQVVLAAVVAEIPVFQLAVAQAIHLLQAHHKVTMVAQVKIQQQQITLVAVVVQVVPVVQLLLVQQVMAAQVHHHLSQGHQ
jgi:hypothetical protein